MKVPSQPALVSSSADGAWAFAMKDARLGTSNISGFDALVDEAEKASYADIPTALQLPEETVDRLRAVAGRILYASKPFQALVVEIGGRQHGVPHTEIAGDEAGNTHR